MWFTRKYKGDQGFTLIEVLVTILIGGIIAAIAAPSFMTWVNNKKINDISTKIEGALKEAQSTAGRRNITCSVLVTATQVSTTNSKCLPSGTRNIQDKAPDVGISNSNLSIAGTGGTTTTVTYLSLGTANITPKTATIIIYRTNETTNGIKKCIVVSRGIGTIKTGNYTGTLPLTDTTSLTGTALDDALDIIADKCIAS
jgi:prepilin-type N-terminal cleavage/methylation domain-containing protein